ncbi:MAG: amino acid-binding protein [Firmicutes bacterium]|nr:amino acid-binding protein [Bacillota bacterium]
MAHRIVIRMAAASGAEARLWALVNQRHIDVTRAWFEKDRRENWIKATLEVDLDVVATRRLMRQLQRHLDIQHIALESEDSFDLSNPGSFSKHTRRLRIPVKKGACL